MLTLLIGGARSGKSALAERLAAASGRPVTFIATMEARDDETRERIAAHRAGRPLTWATIEEPLCVEDAFAAVEAGRCVTLDCVTLWISNLLLEALPDADTASARQVSDVVESIANRTQRLARALAAYDGDVIAVTNEVGMGIVPANPLGRAFRDALGRANAVLASRAERMYMLVAGHALDIKALGARSIDDFGEQPR
jgi:adenosyl cobinamide kinase/adenosyl cobinamide phosphate guanylyltransferase